MRVYFACSIRGGRADQPYYQAIINLLKNYGTVLSEHFGDPNLDPNENAVPAGFADNSDQAIHDLDMKLISEADVIVAEITTPSLGVGYEIGYGENLGKKILALHRENGLSRPSAMIAGSSKVTLKNYQEVTDLKPIFDEFFGLAAESTVSLGEGQVEENQ